MKRRKKARRRGRLRNKLAALAAALVAAALLLALSLFGQQLHGVVAPGPPDPPTATIVDQTAVYDPNPEFVATATDLLEGAGYAVDYYPEQEVTIDLYRDLPTHDYNIIILRVHAAPLQSMLQGLGNSLDGDEHAPVLDEAVLFTTEPYSPLKYREDQPAGRLAAVSYYEGGDEYFGIRAPFVTSGMKGDFDGATIIMMGCSGLTSANATAWAFLHRGADSYVSWDDLISWGHSDAATERLLELMLVEGLDTEEAVKQTAEELGPDPYFGARLAIVTGGG